MPERSTKNYEISGTDYKEQISRQVSFVPLVDWADHLHYYSPDTQKKYITDAPLIPSAANITDKGIAFRFQPRIDSELETEFDEGDIFFCKKVDLEKSSLTPLKLYVVVLPDSFICRRFFRENRHFEFRSDNPSGCHIIISSNLISEIWEVKSILKTQMRVSSSLIQEFHTISSI